MDRGNEGGGAEWLLNSRENSRVYRRESLGLSRVNSSILERIVLLTVKKHDVSLRQQMILPCPKREIKNRKQFGELFWYVLPCSLPL